MGMKASFASIIFSIMAGLKSACCGPAAGRNAAVPVFHLPGGPGGSNIAWAPPDWLLEDHDVVMVGYRGVEGTVVLSCPEVGRLLTAHLGKDLWSEQARLEYV